MYTAICNDLDHFIDTYHYTNQNTGILRITTRDTILYERYIGYADIERKIPFCKNSAFTLYSLSKPFCAIGLLKLRDQKLVDIDRHPAAYVSEARWFDSRVTIRQMLHHTSGLPDFEQTVKFHEIYDSGTPADMRQLMNLLAEHPMLFEPGTQGKYANINFILCAMIIEAVTDMDYADYMRERVFEPLGMMNTLVDRPGLDIADRAAGHDYSGDRILRKDGDVSCMILTSRKHRRPFWKTMFPACQNHAGRPLLR